MPEGRLYYVVGAADADKERVLDQARRRLKGHQPVVFAHRYITRLAAPAAANHVALSGTEFELRRRRGLFVMDWERHGVRYGIGTEINYWLAMGLTVVVDGSRGFLDQALKRYPDMTVVWISAAPQRITERSSPQNGGVEAAVAVTAGRRTQSLEQAARRILYISSDGPLEAAGEELLAAVAGNRN
jgi:ribose 1,5-bisphosphokinase